MKMKKGLIALLLTLPIALTSCLDSSDSEPDPMGPGIEIYSGATVRNQLSLLPTNVAIRLAMILGEADKQKPADVETLTGDEMLTVKDEKGNLLKDLLFSSTTTIIPVDTKFVIDIPNDNTNLYHDGSSSYVGSYSGKVEVETHGNFIFDSDGNEVWEITVLDLKYHTRNGVSYSYDDGCKSYLQGVGGIYQISTEDFNCVYNEFRLLDNWRSSIQLSTATTVNLAYSNVKDGEFKIKGYGQDANFKWDGTATFKGRPVANSDSVIGLLQNGTIKARYLAPDRDLEKFPSDYVEMKFDGQSYTITYNGMVSQR